MSHKPIIHCIAVDDEPKALEVIRFHAAKLDEVNLQACFSDPQEALNYLKNNPVDLIFLDINMPVLTGFDLIQQLKMKYHIIFTTAYSEYAVQSYDVGAVDYLLKPFEFDRFWQAVNKVMEILQPSLEPNKTLKNDQFIFVGDGYKKVRLDFEDIFYVEGGGNYVTIYTDTQKVVSRMRIYEVLAKLPEDTFIRIHNSHIVNLKKIDKIENNHVYTLDTALSISSKYKDRFFSVIESLG